MKYLKIAVVFSLVHAVFFIAYLYVQDRRAPAVFENSPTSGIAPAPSVSETKKALELLPAAELSPQQENPVASASPAIAGRCIISVSGEKYDVTEFRAKHSGGDIFACGQDMTQIFFGQHNQRLLQDPRMQALMLR